MYCKYSSSCIPNDFCINTQAENCQWNRDNLKMTREEALNKLKDVHSTFSSDNTDLLNKLEALGLIKFEEVTKRTVELNKDNFFGDYGLIRIETWPEGLVVWVDGEIIYRSWKA